VLIITNNATSPLSFFQKMAYARNRLENTAFTLPANAVVKEIFSDDGSPQVGMRFAEVNRGIIAFAPSQVDSVQMPEIFMTECGQSCS
jgi:hypothetical protein